MDLRWMLRKTARFFIKPHYAPDSEKLPASAVILVRHNNLKGPINAFLSLRDIPHIWVLDCFFHYKSCYKQYRSYTFSLRQGKKPKSFSLKAALAAAVVVPIVKISGAIPVFRGKRSISRTFEQSLDFLKKGDNLVIAVDKNYNDRISSVEEIYTGFFRLEQLYFNNTGEHLPFIVLHFRNNGSTVCSEPLYFDDNRPFRLQRKELTKTIIQYLNGIYH